MRTPTQTQTKARRVITLEGHVIRPDGLDIDLSDLLGMLRPDTVERITVEAVELGSQLGAGVVLVDPELERLATDRWVDLISDAIEAQHPRLRVVPLGAGVGPDRSDLVDLEDYWDLTEDELIELADQLYADEYDTGTPVVCTVRDLPALIELVVGMPRVVGIPDEIVERFGPAALEEIERNLLDLLRCDVDDDDVVQVTLADIIAATEP